MQKHADGLFNMRIHVCCYGLISECTSLFCIRLANENIWVLGNNPRGLQARHEVE